MPLRVLLSNRENDSTATVATSATPDLERIRTVATIAIVAVVNTRDLQKPASIRCSTVEQMKLVNTLCLVKEFAFEQAGFQQPTL
jgi:5,10-methylene-tetrahydrofolate dehydrogenase/methenyl tetrahydrofolate cyclohydrolase